MQIENYKLIIPTSPDSINKVITYGKKRRRHCCFKAQVAKDSSLFLLRKQYQKIFCQLNLKGALLSFLNYILKLERTRDSDNYEAMCKGIIDAFVQKRLVKDDSSKYVDDDGRRLRVDRDRPRVEIYIKDKLKK